jgi:hypothetical protein
MEETPQHFSSQKLVFGLVLIVVGALAFIDAIDLWNPRVLWRLWPVGLILLGVASEVDAFRARRSDGGSILIGLGVWFLVATHDIFGLTYRTGFPLAVVVVGLFTTLHALVDHPEPVKKENTNEPC